MAKYGVWIFALASLATAAAPKLTCPKDTTIVDDTNCLTVKLLKHNREYGKFRSQSFADRTCNDLTIGKLKWRLPKVDTWQKNKRIAQFFVEQAPGAEKGDVYFWVGLRRFGPKKNLNSDSEWTNENYWLWTRDNTTLMENVKMSYDPWHSNEPDNERATKKKDWKYSEDCVVASVEIPTSGPSNKPILNFRDRMCQLGAEDKDVNVSVIFCEYIWKQPIRQKSFIEKWWFYMICGFMVALPIVILVSIVIYLKKRRHLRSGKTTTQDKLTMSERKRRGKKATRRKFHFEKFPIDETYVKITSDGSGSDDDFCLPGMAGGKSIKAILSPKSTQPKKKSTSKKIPGKGGDIEIEEFHDYSNVESPRRKKPKPIEVPVVKAATVDLIKKG